MTNIEKCELLKETIFKLYSKEGRSKTYISKLLEIDRKTLTNKIKEWNYPEAEPRRHVKPSTQKFINKNRLLIKSRLDRDVSISKIARELNVTRDFLQRTVIPADEVLCKARQDYINRMHQSASLRRQNRIESSSRNYNDFNIDNEIWKPILGYEEYEVSNMGRIRRYAKKNKTYYLLNLTNNKNNNRLYVMLYKNKKRKNLQVSRLVAHAFVPGYSPTKNTVNHKDGNVLNCAADNLEWMSQSENNTHAYRTLNRSIVNTRKYNFRTIIYQNKYEFKTVVAFARFLNLSETQTRRYLDEPQKHNIRLIK